MRHLSDFFLALTQFILFLCLLAFLDSAYHVHRIDTRLILRVRHRPEWYHILNRRNEKGIWTEIFQPRCECPHEAAVHIDRTAAHPLEHPAHMLNKIAARPRHNHPLRAFSALHLTDDLHRERPHLPRRIEHGIRRPLHPIRHLRVRENRRHRKRVRRAALYRQCQK